MTSDYCIEMCSVPNQYYNIKQNKIKLACLQTHTVLINNNFSLAYAMHFSTHSVFPEYRMSTYFSNQFFSQSISHQSIYLIPQTNQNKFPLHRKKNLFFFVKLNCSSCMHFNVVRTEIAVTQVQRLLVIWATI